MPQHRAAAGQVLLRRAFRQQQLGGLQALQFRGKRGTPFALQHA